MTDALDEPLGEPGIMVKRFRAETSTKLADWSLADYDSLEHHAVILKLVDDTLEEFGSRVGDLLRATAIEIMGGSAEFRESSDASIRRGRVERDDQKRAQYVVEASRFQGMAAAMEMTADLVRNAATLVHIDEEGPADE